MKQTSGNPQYQNTKKNTKKLKIGKDAVIKMTDRQAPGWLEYFRCEDYAISLLEQCEDLREVEVFLQTKYSGNKDANYILAILGKQIIPSEGCFWKNSRNIKNIILPFILSLYLDSRMKFVAHERFQYVLLNKFGEEHNWIINNSNILPK